MPLRGMRSQGACQLSISPLLLGALLSVVCAAAWRRHTRNRCLCSSLEGRRSNGRLLAPSVTATTAILALCVNSRPWQQSAWKTGRSSLSAVPSQPQRHQACCCSQHTSSLKSHQRTKPFSGADSFCWAAASQQMRHDCLLGERRCCCCWCWLVGSRSPSSSVDRCGCFRA
jgi:hypothetical protein